MGGPFLGRQGVASTEGRGRCIGSWRFVTFFNDFTGTYTFAQGTKYPFNANDPTTFPFQFTQTFGNSGLNFTDYMAGAFAQDDWEIHPGLTVNVGLRWDKDSLFQGDNNNVAPRVGFAWTVGSDGKTVIRGNSGVFYDTLESSAINRESNTGPVGPDPQSIYGRAIHCSPASPIG